MRAQVLVVDDDPENCRVLSELLATEGFDPIAFENAEAAWAAMACNELLPDVVVADLRMPDLDGLTLLHRIKANFPFLPVFLVSAFPDEETWREGLRAGATDVFPKPIQAGSLVPALREAVGGG